MVEAAQQRLAHCALPEGPKNSRETALSQKTQSFWDSRFNICSKAL